MSNDADAGLPAHGSGDGVRAEMLADYRQTFGSGLRPRELWNDRRRILAEPRVTTEPRPPLSVSPLRFALAFCVVPMLLIGWAMSQLAGLLRDDDADPLGPTALRAVAVEQPLGDYVGETAFGPLKRIARGIALEAMPAQARPLFEDGKRRLAVHALAPEPEVLRRETETWLEELRAAPLSDEQRRSLAARMQVRAIGVRRLEGMTLGFQRSMLEGGWAMQLLGALSLVATAFVFRWFIRRDARFVRAANAHRLYLYFVTSRTFWFTVLSILAFGAMSFASASGDAALLVQANIAMQIAAFGSIVYTLMACGPMVRALTIDGEVPAGARWSLGWRLVVAQFLALLGLMIAGILVGIVVGIAAAFWTMRP